MRLTALVLDFFKDGKKGTMDEVVNYVDQHRPGTAYESVQGAIRRCLGKDTLRQEGELYYLSPVQPKSKVELQKEIPATISTDGVHPLLGRELTATEKELIQLNARKVEGVELDKSYAIIKQQMYTGDKITAMFFGEPGNGKTTIARRIAHELGLPVYSQNFGLNSEEIDIIGGFGPDEESDVAKFRWIDGQFTKAFSEGGVYIAEELNYAKAGVLGVFNNALDGVGEILLRNGKVLQRHPSFRFFSCMNLGLAGTQKLNLALVNRMNKVVKFDPMDKTKQLQVIMKESGYKNRAVIKKMVEAGEAIRKKIKNEQLDGANISIRNLINWANDVKSTNDVLESSWSSVIWAVCMDDEEIQQEIFDDIIKPRFEGVIA